jgi:hypothetical protein
LDGIHLGQLAFQHLFHHLVWRWFG